MENKIRELLTELLEKYRLLDEKVARIEKLGSEVERMQATAEISAEMEEVKRIEKNLLPLKEQFEASGGTFSESTRTLVEESKLVVSGLIGDVRVLENIAKQERENLEPQIRSGVKAIQMQNAYTNNR